MKNILLLFLLCLSFYGFSQNLPTLDEKNGFREMKFGEKVISNILPKISFEL